MVTMPDSRTSPEDSVAVGPENLALEFLHTRRPAREGVVDDLHSPQALLAWLRERRSEPAESVEPILSTPQARALLDEAIRLRGAVAALVQARHRREPLPGWALFGVDRVLAATHWSWRLASAGKGAALEACPAGALPLSLLGPVALGAARLVAVVRADRLRPCASPRCGAWFVDTSKGGRRRWCSMARCGNREKAATHRAKVARG
jgi:predicted RNA-binding Zn ribbon-like protein